MSVCGKMFEDSDDEGVVIEIYERVQEVRPPTYFRNNSGQSSNMVSHHSSISSHCKEVPKQRMQKENLNDNLRSSYSKN